MKWKDKTRSPSSEKTYKSGSETKIPNIENEEDFKEAAKIFHPDVSHPFLKGVNNQKMQQLLKSRKNKKSDR